ncbi:WXG100 family type VII secretion target [Streptacidiphilus sp. MAP12-33]|uniref:WXG100 family type VII secretion target n=1 Tax=Streptacidiphilus sp. MAP12-33 TaxID=3156266 RepID=UPI003516F7E9
MIAESDPGTLDTVAARWAAVDVALRQAQEDLLHHTRAATDHWSGTAADAFTARAQRIHASLGNGADFASHASSGVSYAAEALRAARETMPPEPASLEGVVSVEQAGAVGTTASALHEEQRQQAVAVMELLEERYGKAARMIGTPGIARADLDCGQFSETTIQASRDLRLACRPPANPTAQSVRSSTDHAGRENRVGPKSSSESPSLPKAGQMPSPQTGLDSLACHPRSTSSGTVPENENEPVTQKPLIRFASRSGLQSDLSDEFSIGNRRARLLPGDTGTLLGIGETRHPAWGQAPTAASAQRQLSEMSSSDRRNSVAQPSDFRRSRRDGLQQSVEKVDRHSLTPEFGERRTERPAATEAPNPSGVTDSGTQGWIPGLATEGGRMQRIQRGRHRTSYLKENPEDWLSACVANPPVVDR